MRGVQVNISEVYFMYIEEIFTQYNEADEVIYFAFGRFAPYRLRPRRRSDTPVASYLPRTIV